MKEEMKNGGTEGQKKGWWVIRRREEAEWRKEGGSIEEGRREQRGRKGRV